MYRVRKNKTTSIVTNNKNKRKRNIRGKESTTVRVWAVGGWKFLDFNSIPLSAQTHGERERERESALHYG